MPRATLRCGDTLSRVVLLFSSPLSTASASFHSHCGSRSMRRIRPRPARFSARVPLGFEPRTTGGYRHTGSPASSIVAGGSCACSFAPRSLHHLRLRGPYPVATACSTDVRSARRGRAAPAGHARPGATACNTAARSAPPAHFFARTSLASRRVDAYSPACFSSRPKSRSMLAATKAATAYAATFWRRSSSSILSSVSLGVW